MAWLLTGAKQLPKLMMVYCQLDPKEHISKEFHHGISETGLFVNWLRPSDAYMRQ